MNSGLCECGCGGATSLATRTQPARGQIKGQPNRFRPGHNKPAVDPFCRYEALPNGCWHWQGAFNRYGYGRLVAFGRETNAHRGIWQHLTGITIPPDLHVDHLCRVKACVNPDHLEVVTPSTNERRKYNRDVPEMDPRCVAINRAADRALGRVA